MTNSKKTIISSLIWKGLERGGNQGISFIIQIVLARLLLPEDFGVLSIVVILVNILSVFVQSGLGTALIQKKNSDDLDFDTVFVSSMVLSVIIYSIIFFCAPFISSIFDNIQLIGLIRVLSTIIIVGGINSVQQSYLVKQMNFRLIFVLSTISSIISGSIGIYLAMIGFGVWSLVFQQIVSVALITLLMLIMMNWKPRIRFSYQRFKALFSFGWKMLVSSVIDMVYNNVQGLIIGYKYTNDILGFYSKGKQFPQFIVANVVGSINSVMLPSFSTYQDDCVRLKNAVRLSTILRTTT
jgi:O-antigen/teichoic acid export membrane protein